MNRFRWHIEQLENFRIRGGNFSGTESIVLRPFEVTQAAHEASARALRTRMKKISAFTMALGMSFALFNSVAVWFGGTPKWAVVAFGLIFVPTGIYAVSTAGKAIDSIGEYAQGFGPAHRAAFVMAENELREAHARGDISTPIATEIYEKLKSDLVERKGDLSDSLTTIEDILLRLKSPLAIDDAFPPIREDAAERSKFAVNEDGKAYGVVYRAGRAIALAPKNENATRLTLASYCCGADVFMSANFTLFCPNCLKAQTALYVPSNNPTEADVEELLENFLELDPLSAIPLAGSFFSL